MAFREYEDPQELRRTQLLLAKILGEFDRVCRLLDIPYVAWSGTVIGAVRHKGFIPWDDDIDVSMLREDYERFLKEAPTVLSDGFSIENSRTHADFPTMASFLVLDGTRFVPDFFKTCTYEKPISIDIFPLDKVPIDEKKRKKKSRRAWIWGRLMYVRSTPAPYIEFEGLKKKAVIAICTCAHWAMRLLGISNKKVYDKWEQAALMYGDQESEQVAEYDASPPEAWAATIDELFPAIDHEFEDLTIKIPKEYDTLLTREYGDYMQLPPVEKRKNHYPYLLDFGPYAT